MDVQAMPWRDCIVKALGIDYVTTTSTQSKSRAAHIRYFNDLALADYQRGYKLVKGGFHGFMGERCTHALLASNGERSLLQVSGRDAQRVAALAYTGDNCSRLDVQVTLYVGEENVSKFLEYQKNRARSHRTLRGHTQDVRAVESNRGWETVYIGSRKSDIFIRIYDKFEESKDEEYSGCVRMEIEYKGDRSQEIWNMLSTLELTVWRLALLLLQDLSARGVDVSMVEIERQDIIRPKTRPLKEERTWGWWASQVAPSVAKSVAERGWYTAFQILFSRALTELDKTLIMNSLSVVWGN